MSHGRMYSVAFDNVAVTAAVDFFELDPAQTDPIIIHGFVLGQSSDVGDAAEEILRIAVVRGNTTSGSGGSAGSVTKMNPGDPSTNTATETCNTTQASAGTAVVIHYDTFNIRSGYQWWWTPETRPRTLDNLLLCVRLMAAPADSLNMSGTLYFEEF